MFDVIGSDEWRTFDADLDSYFAAVLLPGVPSTPLAGAVCAAGSPAPPDWHSPASCGATGLPN